MIVFSKKRETVLLFWLWLLGPFIIGTTIFGQGLSRQDVALLKPWAIENNSDRIKQQFFGLFFTHDNSITCIENSQNTLLRCQLNAPRPHSASSVLEIVFEKQATRSPEAANLARINRKLKWVSQFPGLNQYVEERTIAGDYAIVLQKARYFRFNNSFRPVLLHATDIVVNKNTLISISLSVEAFWPALENEIFNVLQSLKKNR